MTRILIITVLAAAVAWTAYYFYTMQSSERVKAGDATSGLTLAVTTIA